MVTNIFNLDYRYILDEFGESKISERYMVLYNYLKEFIERHQYQDRVIISNDLLDQMVIDYFVDIYRLKKFHDISKVNELKIHAYSAYWLLKRKPLQLILYENTDAGLCFVNERMVTGYLLRFLSGTDYGTLILEEKQMDYTDFVENLMYFLQYRIYTPQMLESLLLSFRAGRAIQYSIDYQYEK